MRVAFLVVRAVGALLLGAALVAQYLASLSFADTRGADHAVVTVNFFSYFTIDSNVLATAVLTGGILVLARGRAHPDRAEPVGAERLGAEPLGVGIVRACAVTYMTITGLVYNTLLRGADVAQGAVLPWADEVLHVVGPVLLIVDWLLAPGRARLRVGWIGAIVAFPLVWVAYTLLRGPTAPNPVTGKAGWYPYPFLDPRLAATGYLSVAGYVLVIAVAFAVVGLAAIWVSRRRRAWPLPS